MRLQRGPFPIDVARELVEEALIVAARDADPDLRAAFQEEVEAVQSIETVDIRENHFEALDGHWMERLRVAESLESALARHSGVEQRVSACFLVLARNVGDEKAFFSDADAATSTPAEKPALVVHVTVATLFAIDKLELLLATALGRASHT